MGLSNSAKWQKIPFLVSPEEFRSFLMELRCVEIFRLGKLSEKNHIQETQLLDLYHEYLVSLTQSLTPLKLDTFLATCDPNAVKISSIPLKGNLVSAVLPALIFQPCGIKFDSVSHDFQVLSFGKDTLSWGWQVSYPQLYHDPISCKIHNTLKEQERFLNTPIFKKIQKWMRTYTRPARFSMEGKVSRPLPVRLGKESGEWISQHQQLRAYKIHVE